MKLMPRDLEIMRWIQEQKFMSPDQIRRMFWSGITENSREDYRRLNELRGAGYLKTSKGNIYRQQLYLVTYSGMRQLKTSGYGHGWIEQDAYSFVHYAHDLVVTDLRIMFDQCGYKDWRSERVLAKTKDFRNLSDGMIFHNGNHIAVEFEATQKSQKRYDDIFIDYCFDRDVEGVIYVAATAGIAERICKEGLKWDKFFVTTFQELQTNKLETRCVGKDMGFSLRDYIEERVNQQRRVG